MKKETINKILRWITLVPAIIAAYIISKIIIDLGYNYASADLVHDIATFGGFSGHYIWGPLYVFHKEAFSFGFAVFAGIYTAPQYKKYVYFLLLGIFITLWIIIAIFMVDLILHVWSLEETVRSVIEMVAQIAGVVVAGFYIWGEHKEEIGNTVNIVETQ